MTRRRIAGIAVVLLVVLAGCTGGSPATSPTDTENSQTVPQAIELQRETLAALDVVGSYTAKQNATFLAQRSDDNQSRTTISVEYAANRTDRVVESHRTTTQNGQSVLIDRYVVDGTLYQRSEQFSQQYGSEWIKQEIEGFDRQWHLYDQLWAYRFFLDNSTLSDVTQDTVDGNDTYVMTATVDTKEFNTAVREALGLPPGSQAGVGENTSLSATFWIDTDTNRPVKVERTLSGTQTIDDRVVEFEQTITTRITYEPVTVSLPEEANGATDVGSN